MSKITFDQHALTEGMQRRYERLVEDARAALAPSTVEGAVALQDLLEAAETRTGQRRAESSGGFPGRHDSGNMIASVNENGSTPEVAGTQTWGSFGWFANDFERYFVEQDQGEGNIPAAHALPAAFIRARESFKNRIRQVVK